MSFPFKKDNEQASHKPIYISSKMFRKLNKK